MLLLAKAVRKDPPDLQTSFIERGGGGRIERDDRKMTRLVPDLRKLRKVHHSSLTTNENIHVQRERGE